MDQRGTTEVEIRWTALVPRFTTIDEFHVLLEARYSDGSKGTARSQPLKASARAALLTLPNPPASEQHIHLEGFHEVVAAQRDQVGASPRSSSGRHPQVLITAARLVTQGCSAGQQCVEVRWTAAAPRSIGISEFTARIKALHRDGTQTTDSKTVSGQDRQALLQAGSAELGIDSIKVSLLTSFSIIDTKTAVKEGAF